MTSERRDLPGLVLFVIAALLLFAILAVVAACDTTPTPPATTPPPVSIDVSEYPELSAEDYLRVFQTLTVADQQILCDEYRGGEPFTYMELSPEGLEVFRSFLGTVCP